MFKKLKNLFDSNSIGAHEVIDSEIEKSESLLDFILQNNALGDYMNDPNPIYSSGPSMRWANIDEKVGDNWLYGQINQVPAEFVGGKEGEFRYYGSGANYPFRDDAKQFTQGRLRRKPYTSVSDSIPTLEALLLKQLWEEGI